MSQSDQPVELQAAIRFWNLLGKPKGFSNANWESKMKPLLEESRMSLDEFREFLTWTVNVNEYSVEYLRKAKDPMASLTKNLPSLLKFYGAAEARKQAAAKNSASRPESTKGRKVPSQMAREFNKEKIW